MRFAWIAAAALVLGSCGASDSTSTTDSIEIDEATATALVELEEAILASLGDERTAVAAVLLATDSGYSLEQIADATAAGTFTASGDVGAEIVPAHPATKVIEVPVGGLRSPVADARGAQAPVKTWPLAQVVDGMERTADELSLNSLALLIGIVHRGYNAEQIIEATLLGGSVSEYLALYDASGRWIEPVNAQAFEVSPPPPPATVRSATADDVAPLPTDATLEEQSRLSELVRAAVGVYALGDEVNVLLLNWPETVGASSEGEMEIATDGTISGGFSYWVTQDIELSDGILHTTFTQTFECAPSQLKLRDDGLEFQCGASMTTQQDSDPVAASSMSIDGLVDVELGQVVLLLGEGVDGDFPDVRFSSP